MTTANWASVTGGLPYGWQILYALRVEGMPTIFVERDTGAVDPVGYTADPSLVVDDSAKLGAQVDDRTGVGKSYDMTFHIQRNAVTKAYFRRPALITSLTSTLAYSAAGTMAVADSSGWPASGVVYIGRESIGYAFKAGATSFDGLTRGSPNGDWRAYDWDVNSSIATWVTDAPLFWRGRIVELWAVPVDPYGVVQGADLLDGAAMVWRGHVQTDPTGHRDGWTLSCRSQERRLTEQVGAKASGTGRWQLVADPEVTVDPDWAIKLWIQFDVPTGVPATTEFDLLPFQALAPGTVIRLSEARTLIEQEWATVTALIGPTESTYVKTGAKWSRVDGYLAGPKSISAEWELWYVGSCSVSTGSVIPVSNLTSSWQQVHGFYSTGIATQQPAYQTPDVGWIKTNFRCTADASIGSLLVTLDDGDFSLLPATGWIVCKLGDNELAFEYESLQQVAGQGGEIELYLAPNQADLAQFVADAMEGSVDDFDVTFASKVGPGVPRDLMRVMLYSSGRGDNDPTYDTGSRETGYDLDAVDSDSFDSELDGAWSVALTSQEFLVDDAVSFADVWGGLIALSDRCIVSRQATDGSSVDLAVVQTSLADTGLAELTITDADLLISGGGSNPVRELARPRSPNIIELKLKEVAGRDDGTILINDTVLLHSVGPQKWSQTVRGIPHADLRLPAGAWAASRFEDAKGVRVFEIDVVPWLQHASGAHVEVGDAIQIDSDHFLLWDPATGESGYTGPARVIGRQVKLRDYAQTLTIAIAGTYTQYALAPSAPVISWTGTAAVPVLIRVPGAYYDLMGAFLASASPFALVAYLPSADDATTDGYTISAVDLVGGLTELTVAAIVGAPVLTAEWYLTIPIRGSCNAAQARHLHTDTPGASWR